jgi:hypothetical protein
MNTRVGFIEDSLRGNDSDRSTGLDQVSKGISNRIRRYCLGRLARDLEVRNCLKHIEDDVTHPNAAVCAAEVSLRLERLDE